MRVSARFIASLAASASVLVLAGCASGGRTGRSLPPAGFVSDAASAQVAESYLIGPHDDNTIFASFDNHKMGDFKPYLLKSTDRGKTWTSMAGDLPGNEIQSPMAKVILGGLLTSTLLNIFIVPIIYSWIHAKKASHENPD